MAIYELRRSILESAGARGETRAQREDQSVGMAEVRQVVREYIDHQRSLLRGSPRLRPIERVTRRWTENVDAPVCLEREEANHQ